MKFVFLFLFSLLSLQPKNKLPNSVWICKISKSANDTLKFKNNGIVFENDCESDYTFKSAYKVFKDTIVLTTKDDSHSEDNGKLTFYRTKYIWKGNVLYPFSVDDLIHGKWIVKKFKFDNRYVFKRIN